ncbi:3740_t:CDS:2 [Gigaspora margarita]|uniref:3740_t:CDS:1 n=1 Tax=Gigaspora margarita TaxID=4874 RepID=A0ABM8W1U8_GIGMA|nr:3740_t:CDS:2 [Gigaspora margarita]
MSFFVNQIFEIEPLEYDEQTFNFNISDNITSQPTELQNETLSNLPLPATWTISMKMREIINQFGNTILHQFPCVPCTICSRLMYPEKAEWIPQDPNFHYPLITAYPTENLITNPNPPPNRIAICSSCKRNQNRNYSPYLCQIPPEINSVPLEKRKYLSPIFLHCSLGHTPGANPFSEYRTLVGTMNYSKNLHTFNLYSGILGAYLNPLSESLFTNQTAHPPWFVNSLTDAINWLKENNPYLHAYSRMIPLNLNTTNPFPSAVHLSNDETAPPFQYIQYLTNDPPNIRSKAVLPLHMIDPLDEDPFWNDKIEKYLARPLDPRTNRIFTHIRFLRLEHGKPFFYQQLLLRLPCRSETDLCGKFSSYHDHFLAKFPDIYHSIQEQNHEFVINQTTHTTNQFDYLIETIILSLQPIISSDILDLIKLQLDSIKILPRTLPLNTMINLPPSQYYCMQTITNYLELQDENETAATSQVNTNLNITHIVCYRKTAYQINEAICK